MSLTRKGAVDLESIAEKVVDKLLNSDKFMDSLATMVRKSIREELATISKEFQQKVDQLEDDLKTRIYNLEDMLDSQEQYSRINNLRIFGVEEKDGEDTVSVVRTVCEEKLGIKLSPCAIDVAHRLRKKELRTVQLLYGSLVVWIED